MQFRYWCKYSRISIRLLKQRALSLNSIRVISLLIYLFLGGDGIQTGKREASVNDGSDDEDSSINQL